MKDISKKTKQSCHFSFSFFNFLFFCVCFNNFQHFEGMKKVFVLLQAPSLKKRKTSALFAQTSPFF